MPAPSTATERTDHLPQPLEGHAPKSMQSGEKGQWAVLAGLRFVLAMIVVCSHIDMLAKAAPDNGLIYWTGSLGPAAAVFAFFIVSGYSIHASVERETSQFYRRRWWRIAPIYLACFFFAAVVQLWTNFKFTNPVGGIDYLFNALCLQTHVTHPLPVFNQSWTLACEVIYYVFAPKLARLSTGRLIGIALASFVFYTIHFFNDAAIPYPGDWHFWPVLSLAWLWILGFLFWRHRTHRWAAALLIAIPAATFPMDWGAYLPPFEITMIFATVVIALAPKCGVPERLSRALKWLGDISYPLYLIHFPVTILALYWTTAFTRVPLKYLMGLSLATAILLHYTVELPSRRKLARLIRNEAGLAAERPERKLAI